MKVEKANLGSEDGVVCDRCGVVVDRNKVKSIYIGDSGQKIDYCPQCFDHEMVKND